MKNFSKILVFCLTLLLSQTAIQAQTTGSISGTVVDQAGAVVPGATVVVKGEAGQEFTATTNDDGFYAVPSVSAGLYTVTVSAANFKTSIIRNVKVDIGLPSTANTDLTAGKIEETVVVTSGGEVLQTATATVGTTITGRQISETPISSRDALDLILRLPGVASVGAPRQSSINGLPKGAIQISLDGVDDQDNVLRSSDGFFTFVRPRVDAIEEVTVSTANPGAESSGDGAVQVRFVTKRGNNRYTGSLYSQVRNTWLNSAYYYNNRDLDPLPGSDKAPRDVIQLNQPGGAVGGPIPFPRFGDGGGPYFDSGKNKAFFFVNYEQFRIPGSITRVRNVANAEVQNGIYNYLVGGVTRTVNLFNIAAAAGLPSTIDPTVNAVLNEIRAATATTGTFTPIDGNVNLQNFNFQNATNGFREFLAVRLDFNIHKNHSVEYVQNRQNFHPSIDTINGADQPFPGGRSYGQGGIRKTWTGAVRSTLTQSVINEGRFAQSGGGTEFNQGADGSDFTSQRGFSLGAFLPGITSLRAAASNNTSFRTTPTSDFTDNITWIRGNHTINFGGQYKYVKTENTSVGQFAPTVGFGIDTTDTAAFALFTATNIPGATPTQLAEARAFYAGLTGRVLSYGETAVLQGDGTFGRSGTSRLTSVEQTQYGLFAQDTWRIRPNLTINYGLRWQPQLGVVNLSRNQSRLVDYATIFGTSGEGNLFRPGTLTGSVAQNRLLEVGERILPDDWNNFAPSVGLVWSPNFSDRSFFGTIFGANGKSVIRGGYSDSFVREGLNVSSQVVAGPGGTRNLSRSTAITGSLTTGTLFRTPNNPNLTPFNFIEEPSFPITLGGTDQAFGVDPNLTTGLVRSFSFGVQRELDKNTVVEVRYVGNRGVNGWRLFGINERNTIENGLAAEFALAQANLYSNVAARRCQGTFQDTNPLGANFLADCRYNFAYFGAGSGTNPLPIALAYIIGNAGGNRVTFTPGAIGSNGSVTSTGALTVSNYTNALFRNTATFAGLNQVSASPLGYAAGLAGTAGRRANSTNAGLPINFQFVNGELNSGAFILGNSNNSSYDSLVIEVRRRLSAGLRVQASYVFSKALSDFFGVSSIVNSSTSLRDDGLQLARTVQPFDLTHNFKLDSTYDLPIGRGRWLLSNAGGLVNSLLGGFTISPVISWQSGSPISIGNVNLVGLTVKELEDAVRIRKTDSGVFWLPEDIILNSQRAFNTSLTSPTGYADSFVSGAPTGRFIAPSGFDNCQAEYVGRCGFNNLVIHGPGFFKLDVGISKRFAVGETRSFELRANILNATNTASFRVGGFGVNTTGSGCCGSTFGELLFGSAYRDNNTTNDPGGRVIDLLLRFNF